MNTWWSLREDLKEVCFYSFHTKWNDKHAMLECPTKSLTILVTSVYVNGTRCAYLGGKFYLYWAYILRYLK